MLVFVGVFVARKWKLTQNQQGTLGLSETRTVARMTNIRPCQVVDLPWFLSHRSADSINGPRNGVVLTNKVYHQPMVDRIQTPSTISNKRLPPYGITGDPASKGFEDSVWRLILKYGWLILVDLADNHSLQQVNC